MKNILLLLSLLVSFGLNATCHRYNYQLMTLPIKGTYVSSIFYCVNDDDGTLSIATNWDADYGKENTVLNENNKQFSYTSRTEFSKDKRVAAVFLDWTSSQERTEPANIVEGTVVFKVDDFGAIVYGSEYYKKDNPSVKEHRNVLRFEREY